MHCGKWAGETRYTPVASREGFSDRQFARSLVTVTAPDERGRLNGKIRVGNALRKVGGRNAVHAGRLSRGLFRSEVCPFACHGHCSRRTGEAERENTRRECTGESGRAKRGTRRSPLARAF